jgi:biotin carboxyl carrier protein
VKIEIKLRDLKRTVEISRTDGALRFVVDGRSLDADPVEIAPGIYSILIEGQSFEARVDTTGGGLRVSVAGREYAAQIVDPRQRKRYRGGAIEVEGRQQVIAPMPGKVVRVLAAAGDVVEAGKGLVVIEAMKMQNEVRSPKSGTIERMLVAEGQAVNSGDVLAVVV